MATTSTTYIFAGVCVLAASTYIFLQRSQRDTATKQTSHAIDQEIHTSLIRARDANARPSSRQTLTLPDGRTLGYAIYGTDSSDAPTILCIHGYGDNRLSGGFFAPQAEDLGVRLISIDRPGWGLSSTHMGSSALDLAEDIKCLVKELHLRSYGLIGVSGGGPSALACAYALPKEQLKSVTMLIACGPWNETTLRHSHIVPWLYWQVMGLSTRLQRWIAKRSLDRYRDMSVEEFVKANQAMMNSWFIRMVGGAHEKDVALFADDEVFRYSFELVQENIKRGGDVDGMVEDWRIITTNDPGFRVEDIREDLPIQLWYGRLDFSVSWRVGEDLKRMLGEKATLHVLDETHLTMLLSCRKAVLEQALADMRGSSTTKAHSDKSKSIQQMKDAAV